MIARDDQSTTGTGGRTEGGAALPVALVLLAVLAVVLLRLPYYDDDVMKSDEAIYAVTARAWSHGLLPGRDTWDNKPPGMAGAYLLGGRLARIAERCGHAPGGMIAGSRLLALVLALVTLLVTVRLARLAAPGLPAWPVGVAYVLITHANGWHPAEWVVLNGELPATALVAVSALCLAEWARTGCQARRLTHAGGLLVLAGVCGGMALLFRQTALLPVAAMGLWLIWAAAKRRGGRGAWAAVGVVVGGMALGWAPLVGYYAGQGALRYLWAAWGGYGLAYAGQGVAWAEAWGNVRASLGVGIMPALAGLGVMGAIFAIGRARRGGDEEGSAAGPGAPRLAAPVSSATPAAYVSVDVRRPLLLLMIALGVGSALAVLPGGHLFDHYFLQAAPPWALAAGLGVAYLARRPGSRVVRGAAAVMLALGVVVLLSRLLLSHPAEQRAAMRAANREVFGSVAEVVRARTSPSDRVLVWAWAPQVYWYSERLPAARDLTLNYALGWIGRQPQELFPGARAALLEDLRRTRPPVIVVSNDGVLPFSESAAWRPEAAPEVWAFIRGEYRLARRMAHWDVYEARSGSFSAHPSP
jgi:hypothetical protein